MSGRTPAMQATSHDPAGCCLLGAAGCWWLLLAVVWGACAAIHALSGRAWCPCWVLLAGCCWMLVGAAGGVWGACAAIHALSGRAWCPCSVLLAGCCWCCCVLPCAGTVCSDRGPCEAMPWPHHMNGVLTVAHIIGTIFEVFSIRGMRFMSLVWIFAEAVVHLRPPLYPLGPWHSAPPDGDRGCPLGEKMVSFWEIHSGYGIGWLINLEGVVETPLTRGN